MTRFPIPWRWKWPAGALAWATALLLYADTNAATFQQAPTLRLSVLDQVVPFWPWTVWLYWTGWLFVGVCWYLAASPRCFHRQLYVFLVTVFVSCALFALFPARFPRELAPLPPWTDPWSAAALGALRRLDLPANTAPSLHASLAVALALDFREDARYPGWPLWLMSLWAAGLVASAVTTRQHALFDVATGAALGAAVHFAVARWTRD